MVSHKRRMSSFYDGFGDSQMTALTLLNLIRISRLGGIVGAQRQAHCERGARARSALDRQPAAVAVEDVLDQRQAQAGAALRAAFGRHRPDRTVRSAAADARAAMPGP